MADVHTDRRDRLFETLDSSIEAVMIPPSKTMRYFTGLEMHQSERPTVLVLQRGQPPAVVLPALETSRVRDALGEAAEFFIYTDATDPLEAARGAFEDLQEERAISGQVGMEYRSTRLLEYELIADAFDWAAIVDAEDAIASLRARKDEQEIEHMREAAAIVDDILEATVETVEPGMTERDVARDIEKRTIDSPADELGVLIVTSGPNTAKPHTNTSDREIEAGDPLMIDAGVVCEGYYSDITRTFNVGEPDEKFREIYEVVRDGARAGRAAVEEGVELQALDRAARDVIEDAGYGEYFTHRLGHGLGLEGHEPPYLVEGNETPLAVGNAFTVEPGVYIEGFGGVRIEDDVVLTEDGTEVLTGFPRNLRIL
ncbi:MAG: Xaa-Pro peptidase family protein [Halobacteriales archaeon]|nr:Xaa-Pro peptidase family protein [Halobacteriales archaeon]